MNMKKVLIGIVAIFIILGIVGCGGINSVTLSKEKIELVEGKSYQVIYTVTPEDSDTTELKWKATDDSVATVSETGEILAVSPGETSITVGNGEELFGTCYVTVLQKPAYERLYDWEKKFVDTFLKHITSFKNPDSVSIEEVSYIEDEEDPSASFWIVTVSAVNGLGARNSERYILHPNYGLWETDLFHSIGGNGNNYFDIKKINEAISERR